MQIELNDIIQTLAFVFGTFAVAAPCWMVYHYFTTTPAVKHHACSQCRYTVEFSKSTHCPECGANLAEVGILIPDGRRQERIQRRFRMNVVLMLPFTLYFAFITLVSVVSLARLLLFPEDGYDDTKLLLIFVIATPIVWGALFAVAVRLMRHRANELRLKRVEAYRTWMSAPGSGHGSAPGSGPDSGPEEGRGSDSAGD